MPLAKRWTTEIFLSFNPFRDCDLILSVLQNPSRPDGCWCGKLFDGDECVIWFPISWAKWCLIHDQPFRDQRAVVRHLCSNLGKSLHFAKSARVRCSCWSYGSIWTVIESSSLARGCRFDLSHDGVVGACRYSVDDICTVQVRRSSIQK